MNSFEFMNSCLLCKMGKINGIYKNIGLKLSEEVRFLLFFSCSYYYITYFFVLYLDFCRDF